MHDYLEKAKYKDLFLKLLDVGFLVDVESNVILAVNDSCERVLGFTLQKVLGRPIGDLAEPSYRDELVQGLRIARRRYYPREWETRLIAADGRVVPIRMTACAMEIGEGEKVIQVLGRDITQERLDQDRISQFILQLSSANTKLEALSTTDEMTQLKNFRFFKNTLEAEHERCQRYERPYSLIFFDLDHFKHYNDRNGHPAGDELLRGLSDVLMNQCRSTDILARDGGEEFVVLATETELAEAVILAERLREAIDKQPFAFAEFQPLGKVSASIGVAAYPGDGLTAAEVLEAADQAVYQSKANGRNRVTVARNSAQVKIAKT